MSPPAERLPLTVPAHQKALSVNKTMRLKYAIPSKRHKYEETNVPSAKGHYTTGFSSDIITLSIKELSPSWKKNCLLQENNDSEMSWT